MGWMGVQRLVILRFNFISSSSKSSTAIPHPPVKVERRRRPSPHPLPILYTAAISLHSSYSNSTAATTTTIPRRRRRRIRRKTEMSFTTTTPPPSSSRSRILLFDIMDTIVRDPFYQDIPSFFGMSMDELLQCKHPTAWIDFEKGLIDEMQLSQIFFKDGRPMDLEGLKNCMRQGYSYVEGVEELLIDLKKMGYEMHATTNYPIWYELIEERLRLSTYLSWTFCSCTMGKRKPDPEFYMDVLKHLQVEPSCCIFIDDRMRNVEAALEVGFVGIQFKNVDLLRQDLSQYGVNIQTSN